MATHPERTSQERVISIRHRRRCAQSKDIARHDARTTAEPIRERTHDINEITASRRNALRLAGSVVAASAALSANEGLAYQGNMERALSSLCSSLASLREASSDKGGHKAKAAQLIQQAIREVQQGSDYTAEKFGD